MNKVVNVILLGDSDSGKTTLFNRFLYNRFESTTYTIGSEFAPLHISDYKLNIWDTAGREQFDALTSSCYSKADIILFMYDVSNQQSYDNIKKWIAKYNLRGSPFSLKLLVGNKSDVKQTVVNTGIYDDECLKTYIVSAKMEPCTVILDDIVSYSKNVHNQNIDITYNPKQQQNKCY